MASTANMYNKYINLPCKTLLLKRVILHNYYYSTTTTSTSVL